jgi:copper homeostasis protein
MTSKGYGAHPRLEVIVTSREEGQEAEEGGADRLELVRDLDAGGLTPSLETIRSVIESVSIPVRVMLRDSPSMHIGREEIPFLARKAREICSLPIDGLVVGAIVTREPDLDTLQDILGDLPCKATFHRAFDEIEDPEQAISNLKSIPQIDRILTAGGSGSWTERCARLQKWESLAAPEIRIIVAAGLCPECLLASRRHGFEVHVGRAAREGHATSGKIRRELIAALQRRGE